MLPQCACTAATKQRRWRSPRRPRRQRPGRRRPGQRPQLPRSRSQPARTAAAARGHYSQRCRCRHPQRVGVHDRGADSGGHRWLVAPSRSPRRACTGPFEGGCARANPVAVGHGFPAPPRRAPRRRAWRVRPPSRSASRVKGHVRSAALEVTPAASAPVARGHYRTASVTVTPTPEAARTRGKLRSAALAVSPSLAAAARGLGYAYRRRPCPGLTLARRGEGPRALPDRRARGDPVAWRAPRARVTTGVLTLAVAAGGHVVHSVHRPRSAALGVTPEISAYPFWAPPPLFAAGRAPATLVHRWVRLASSDTTPGAALQTLTQSALSTQYVQVLVQGHQRPPITTRPGERRRRVRAFTNALLGVPGATAGTDARLERGDHGTRTRAASPFYAPGARRAPRTGASALSPGALAGAG